MSGELPHFESLIEAITEILDETTGTKLQFRDPGLFESAFNRPSNLIAYAPEPPSPEALAASLAYGVSKNHALIDGNKRASAVAFIITLFLNGRRLDATQAELVETFLKVANGEMGEDALRAWASERTIPDARFAGS